MGSGNGTEERGFSGIGISDEPDVGDRAEFEVKPSLLSRITLRVLPGHPVCGALEMGVSLAAVPAFAEDKLLSIRGQVANGLLLDRFAWLLAGPVNDRAHWHPDDGRPRVAAVFVFPFAMGPATRTDKGIEKKRDEIVGVVIGLKNNVPAIPSVPTIRSSVRDEFFAPEAAASIAAVPGLRMNADLVNKSHSANRVLENGGRVESKGPRSPAANGH